MSIMRQTRSHSLQKEKTLKHKCKACGEKCSKI